MRAKLGDRRIPTDVIPRGGCVHWHERRFIEAVENAAIH
jgi:hypothetical protein